MKSKLFLAALFLSSAVAFAQESKEPQATLATPVADNKNAPEFKFTEEVYNFGTIKQGEKVIHTFAFANTGNEPLIISNAQGSCHCTVPDWSKEPIMKGGQGTIKVEFNSDGKMGIQDKTVTIYSNAKTNPMVIHMKGTVEVVKTADHTSPAKDNQAPVDIRSK